MCAACSTLGFLLHQPVGEFDPKPVPGFLMCGIVPQVVHFLWIGVHVEEFARTVGGFRGMVDAELIAAFTPQGNVQRRIVISAVICCSIPAGAGVAVHEGGVAPAGECVFIEKVSGVGHPACDFSGCVPR